MFEVGASEDSQYSKPQYWNKRYAEDRCAFEWYGNWSDIRRIVTDALPKKKASILHIGCGMSSLDQKLNEAGYHNVVNCDFSETLIAHKQLLHPELTYRVEDVCSLSHFEESSFDCVLDKAVLDCVLTSTTFFAAANAALSEIYRVLRPDGVYICFSFAQPLTRLHLLKTPERSWEVTTHTIVCAGEQDDNQVYCAYICRKSGPSKT